jgi:hypothetical protein
MSNETKTLDSGTPVAQSTAEIPAISEAAKEFALTVALQKTEWHTMKKTVARLQTFMDSNSGTLYAAVMFAIPNENIVADPEKFTFLVSGTDVDEIVAQVAQEK